jgi:hypothetical protein
MRQVAVLTERTLDGVRIIGEVCTVCLKAGPLAAADRARKFADWLSLRAELLRLDVGHLEDMDADNWNAVVKELDVLSQRKDN